MAKTKITRTYGPVHFEDLVPHRFEDLIRELIYDYKDWRSIEATGRSGNDDGFDIRVYEKTEKISEAENEEDATAEERHPMEGNLWMIQGKREKEIGPQRIVKILEEVDSKNPPYGYILAASANFSKKSYDIFRQILREKGVMEFYLWGKAELEDMLHLPKNDRILFTFFGISLVSKRKSRATEIRFAVNNKNKLYRILGETTPRHNPILLRDSKDDKYPFKGNYKDFDKHPRWREYPASEYHPLGLVVKVHEFFAYVDARRKEFDFSVAVSLVHRRSEADNNDWQKKQEVRGKVEDLWSNLPRRHQAKFFRDGIVRYDDMLVIDDKGDTWHSFPHIFVDFDGPSGPFDGFFLYAKIGNTIDWLKDYKRVKIFPKSFAELAIGTVHRTKEVVLDEQSLRMLTHGNETLSALYDSNDKYAFLKPGDVIGIANSDKDGGSKAFIQITYVEKRTAKEYLSENPVSDWNIQQQIGRKLEPTEVINIYEFKRIYDWKFAPKKTDVPPS